MHGLSPLWSKSVTDLDGDDLDGDDCHMLRLFALSACCYCTVDGFKLSVCQVLEAMQSSYRC